ncbi:MAG: ABC transporter permease [Pararhizobium sp.]
MTTKASFSFGAWAARNRWVWAAVGVVALWVVLSFVTSRFSIASLSGIATSASFLLLVGLGQTLVVTTGRGNIDLSIASVITFSAYLALILIRGEDALLLPGLAAIVAIGVLVGLVNAALVVLFRIQAIIATLATGYILATGYVVANRYIPGFKIAPALHVVATERLGPVPIIAIVALAATVLTAYVLNATVYGRTLSAVGQNIRAARLSGVRTGRVVAIAFVASSTIAAITGVLLGAYIGGAFLEMGQPYLLQSVGAVVLGGTLIFGGAGTAFGTLFGSVLLVLIVTTMQIAGLPPGTQDVIQGLVIITVLALAGGGAIRRKAAKPEPAATPVEEQAAG